MGCISVNEHHKIKVCFTIQTLYNKKNYSNTKLANNSQNVVHENPSGKNSEKAGS